MSRYPRVSFCFAIAATFALFGGAGCGDDDGGGSSRIPLTELESSYYELFCQKAMECPDNWIVTKLDSVDECIELIQSQGDMDDGLADLVGAVDGGNTEYDGEQAKTCMEETLALSCEAFHGSGQPESCQSVFTGLLADGESCRLDEECAGGWCDTREACPGVCATEAIEGESCEGGIQCAEGFTCLEGMCAVEPDPLPEGEDCSEHWCAYGLFCNSDMICEAWRGVGESCQGDWYCQAELMCLQGECSEVTLVDQEGVDCDPYSGVICDPFAGLSCAMEMQTESFDTCVVSPQAGEACFDQDAGLFIQCDMTQEIYCDFESGNCEEKKAGGEACTASEQCLSGYCQMDDTCAPVEVNDC